MKTQLKSIKVEIGTAHIIWVVAKSRGEYQYQYIQKLVRDDLNPEMLAYARRMGIEL